MVKNNEDALKEILETSLKISNLRVNKPNDYKRTKKKFKKMHKMLSDGKLLDEIDEEFNLYD